MIESWSPAAPIILGRRPTIAILAHELFGLDDNTTISIIARRHWVGQGCRVLTHRGTKVPPPADIAVLHVPLTRVQQCYADLSLQYARTINGAVLDTSKRRIATDLLSEADPYDGPVIVKTDLNHGGIAERRVRRDARGCRKRMMWAMERRLPRHWFGCLPDDRYIAFPAKRDVPGWVWRSRGLVVQPLHVERRGDFFALHQWYFLGSRDCVSTFLARDAVVKLSNVVERLPLHADVPDSIRRRRAQLGFDYGKFDYVIADGTPILLDANNTPNEGDGGQDHPRVQAICAALAGGLSDFVR